MEPKDVYRAFIEAGTAWADKDEAYLILDGAVKSVLAEITLKYRKECKSKTDAETMALADTDYRNFIDCVCKAKGEANRARVKYDATKAAFEASRTKAATLRQEMKL